MDLVVQPDDEEEGYSTSHVKRRVSFRVDSDGEDDEPVEAKVSAYMRSNSVPYLGFSEEEAKKHLPDNAESKVSEYMRWKLVADLDLKKERREKDAKGMYIQLFCAL